MNQRRSLLTVGLILIFLGSISLAQDNDKYGELPNFHQVNSNVYRGGQPRSGGMRRLKQLGIKTVINLRDDDERAQQEEAEAKSEGLRYFNIPLSNFGRPADAVVDQVLQEINSSENQPVFVHCHRGADRTGTIIAIYRIEHDGWSSEKAKAEAKQYGLGFWQVHMKDFIHDYYERRSTKTSAAASSPN